MIANPIGDPKDEREQVERIAADVMPLLRSGSAPRGVAPAALRDAREAGGVPRSRDRGTRAGVGGARKSSSR